MNNQGYQRRNTMNVVKTDNASTRPARKKVCRFCTEKSTKIDYKDPHMLRYFITDRGKILPRRISGNCAKHQREITLAVKRARALALLAPTVIDNK